MKLLKSKTIVFSMMLALFGVIESNLSVFKTYLGDDSFGIFTVIVSMIVAGLRVVTTTSLSEK